ncbi:MAG: KTSC domain-containing protein [Pirellulaceae bacterium]|nr:KTSC domain-containing protein [Pirellulaceae bacterium]
MLEWHPDRFEGDLVKQAAATKHAAAINAAFERLSERLQLGPIPRCVPCYNRVPTSRPPHGRRRQRACHRAPPTPGFPDPDVCEVFVESSHIVSAGYDHDTGTLYLKFTDNSVYAYLDVPEFVYSDFLAAESHGRFAHQHIYRHYESVCC